jgi:formylglycine-generating enzyme required for sulfatase activity
MSENFKKFLVEDVRRLSPSGAHVALGVFGKHPGWNDFIEPTAEVTQEDLGLETDSLNLVKIVLLVNGIGGQIDSAAWEALEPAKQLPGFGHVFVWQRSGQFIIGRLWSSSDGKGRKKYPMVACAHFFGVPLGWALKQTLPVLKDVEEGCLKATKADDVRRILLRSRAVLRAAVSAEGDKGEYSPVPQAELQRILHPPGNPNPEAFLRVLYQVEQQLGPFSAGGAKARNASATAQAQQIRVPVVGDAPEQSLLFWTKFFLKLVDPSFPMLITMPLEKGWVDVTVGEPQTQEFFCLRATPKALPLSSEVPYKLEESFRSKAARYLEGFQQGTNEGFQFESQTTTVSAGPEPAKGGILKWLGVGVFVVIAGAAVMLLLPKDNKPVAAASTPVTNPPADDAAKLKEKAAAEEALLAEEKKKEAAVAAEATRKADAEAAVKAKEQRDAELASAAEEKKKADMAAAAEAETKRKALQDAEIARQAEEQKKADAIAAAKQKADAEAAALKAEQQRLAALAQQASNAVTSGNPVNVAIVAKVESPVKTNEAVVVPKPLTNAAFPPSSSGQTEFTNSAGMVLEQLPSGMWVGKYEVTQAEYRRVMGKNPSKSVNDLQPVEEVSWNDALLFCRKLTEMEKGVLPPGAVYTLPTEKQWIELCGGEKFTDLPPGTIGGKSAPPVVGSSGLANKYGLYDVLGSVWEWCMDDVPGGEKLLKGGAYNSANFDRQLGPDQTASNCGFRCIIVTQQAP